MATETSASDRCTLVVDDVRPGRLVARVPHTDYQLHLLLPEGFDAATLEAGARVKVRIAAEGLRIHRAGGGGRFVEPVWGEPRIVAGIVGAVEREAGRILLRSAVPMWVTPPADQDWTVLEPGALVNGYVRGARVAEVG